MYYSWLHCFLQLITEPSEGEKSCTEMDESFFFFFGDLPQPVSWRIKWECERCCLSLHCQSELLLIISGCSPCCMQLINNSASCYSVSFISHSPLIRPSAKSCSSRSATAGTTSATPSWPFRETARLSGARTRIQPVPPPPPTLWWFWNWWWVTAGGCRRRCWPSWLQRRAGTEGWVSMRFFIFREADEYRTINGQGLGC